MVLCFAMTLLVIRCLQNAIIAHLALELIITMPAERTLYGVQMQLQILVIMVSILEIGLGGSTII